jgi:hypothetical protein
MAFSAHGLTQPARGFIAITPDDDTDIPAGCSGLFLGATGDLVVQDRDGTEVTFSDVPAGFAPISPKRIMEATTASDIVALYA